MNKICTSIDQSQKLIELGVDVNTADMYHAPDANVIIPEPYITKVGDETLIPAYKGAVPAWSLTALFHTLPSASLDSSDDHYFRIHCMEKFSEWYDNPIDAVFGMIVWLKENGKI